MEQDGHSVDSWHVQAVKHALDKQGLSSVFISTQRAVSVHHLLKKTTNILRDAKPKADVLMIMTIGE